MWTGAVAAEEEAQLVAVEAVEGGLHMRGMRRGKVQGFGNCGDQIEINHSDEQMRRPTFEDRQQKKESQPRDRDEVRHNSKI
jgi:hypothetical protein